MDREDLSDRKPRQASRPEAEDPTVRLVYELATKPPTKDVASIKAASDVYEANRDKAEHQNDLRRRRAGNRKGTSAR